VNIALGKKDPGNGHHGGMEGGGNNSPNYSQLQVTPPPAFYLKQKPLYGAVFALVSYREN
jgi:hypothetical protein